ncbi:MAG: tRNA (adenosine(37)-N6)-dimethylallyltransferase MiaA [Deltaproteobacteria bacterium]|nr:tRNA (adenosine(37)-N6)-dimethylallyltransferase MiaA [Deltaproteobacteria bacterium]
MNSMPGNTKPKLVIIAGPTASGKSALGIEMALDFGGEIVNADSMQVYRGMDIGTAKVSIRERKGVPHHLLDIVDPCDPFNAATYRLKAEPVLKDIHSRRKVCFIVGGTGLYIKILLGGLLACPPTDHELRNKLYQDYEAHGLQFLYDQLHHLDPESATNIHPHDKIRIIRALEIFHLANQPFSTLVRKHGFKGTPYQALKIGIHVDREVLYQRINERSISMIESGFLEETQDLLNKGYSPGLKAMKSLGYRHAVRFLKKEWDRDELVHRLQIDTRRYAKRQLTWFKADPEMVWIDPGDKIGVKKLIKEFI